MKWGRKNRLYACSYLSFGPTLFSFCWAYLPTISRSVVFIPERMSPGGTNKIAPGKLGGSFLISGPIFSAHPRVERKKLRNPPLHQTDVFFPRNSASPKPFFLVGGRSLKSEFLIFPPDPEWDESAGKTSHKA